MTAEALLPEIYSNPDQYDLLARWTAPDDLPFYAALAAESAGPILELGSGTGRVAIDLAGRGHQVIGLELSPALLHRAKRKAAEAGIAVSFAAGDLRRFDLGRSFPLILLPYNTLNHLLDPASIRAAFASVRAHMDARSRFVIDTFQPSPAFLSARPEDRRPILRYVDPARAEEVVLSEENHYDPATQVNRIVWSYEIGGRAEARVEELTMRLYFPSELDALLGREGFVIEAKYGGYDRRPFDSVSSQQLYVCRLAPRDEVQEAN
jgi:SAM-dependent methyltransferase